MEVVKDVGLITCGRSELILPESSKTPSIGGGAGNVCLGVIHMEEEVQDRVQVEVEREEQGEGETHGKEQSEEQIENRRSTAHHG